MVNTNWDILSIKENLLLQQAAVIHTLAQAIKRKQILKVQFEPGKCKSNIVIPEGDTGKLPLISPKIDTGNLVAPSTQSLEGISFLDINKQKTLPYLQNIFS